MGNSFTRRSALTVIAGGGLAWSARHAAAEAKEAPANGGSPARL
jgi:hypothetical protein